MAWAAWVADAVVDADADAWADAGAEEDGEVVARNAPCADDEVRVTTSGQDDSQCEAEGRGARFKVTNDKGH